MPKIQVNDINIFYETFGKGEPLVLVAGFAANHLLWRTVVEKLAQHYQVIVFDNRGSGQSDCPDIHYTIEMLSDDTLGFCKALGFNSAYFIGSSMGGMIVQDLAYRYPSFVKAAILENSNMQTDIRFATVTKGIYKLMRNNAPVKALIEITLPWIFSSHFLKQAGVLDAQIQLSLDNPYPMTTVGYKNQGHAVSHFNSRPWIAEVQTPCLVTAADKDIIFDANQVKEMSELIPHAKYHCFHDVGHVPHLEQPEAFCKLALEFLKRNFAC